MEREIIMGGIGGQGVQLATKILAQALNGSNRHVMHFAAFGGTMRGGNVECTVVTGTDPLLAPPIIPMAWMTLTMHPQTVEVVRPKTRSGGLYVVNTSLVEKATAPDGVTLVEIPASKLADEIGNMQGAAMVMLAAAVRATDLVSLDALVEALKTLTPSYRQATIERNVQAFAAGDAYAKDHLQSLASPAWATAVA